MRIGLVGFAGSGKTAEMTFSDIPGEYGAEKRGLSPRMLQQIRDQEALCLVVRDFPNPALDTDPDPSGDLDAFHTECLFAGLDIMERRGDVHLGQRRSGDC